MRMEIKTIEVPYMGDERQIFEIFVRKNEDVGYYLIPKDEVIDLLPLLKKGEINYEAVPANSDQISVLPVRLSKYDVNDLDEKDVVALYTDIQIDELYEVMEYIHTHDNRYDNIILRIYKNSELPEFRNKFQVFCFHEFHLLKSQFFCSFLYTFFVHNACSFPNLSKL